MAQMKLFQPIPVRPRWIELPLEIRQPALRLLARLLREHFAVVRERSAFAENDHE
jgi:hypothetical protein